MSGDYTLGETFYFLFTTRRFSTGPPFVLAGSPVISAYENESLTQITAGITLGVDHDGVAGLNLVTVVATGGNGFEAGKDYHLVITIGTVDSVSVVGEVVGRFTLGRSAAAVDLANATDGLSALKTLIDTIDDFLDTEVAAIKTKTDFLPSATAGAAGGVFIAGSNAATSITTGLTSNLIGNITGALSGSVGSVTGAVGSVTAGVTLAASAVQAIWDALTAALTVAGSIGKLLVDNITGNAFTRLGAPSGASVSADIASVKAVLPAALTSGGNMKSDALALNGDTVSAANIAKTTRAIGRGTVTAGGTTTSIPTSAFTPNGVVADQFKGRIVTFDADTATTALRGQSSDITANTSAAAPVFTVTALTTAPASGDTFSVT